jgi:hypothetical protein
MSQHIGSGANSLDQSPEQRPLGAQDPLVFQEAGDAGVGLCLGGSRVQLCQDGENIAGEDTRSKTTLAAADSRYGCGVDGSHLDSEKSRRVPRIPRGLTAPYGGTTQILDECVKIWHDSSF